MQTIKQVKVYRRNAFTKTKIKVEEIKEKDSNLKKT
jgi:hypothetical protein